MARFGALVFDVDGVLVDSPHEEAWRESLRELMEGDWADLRSATSWTPDAFTPRIYQHEVSGKPRLDGARAALDHFGVPQPAERAVTYADHKQAMVVRLIDAGDFTAYPDALRFLLAVKEVGLRTAAASSSKNAGLFLSRIRLDEFVADQGLSSTVAGPGTTLLDAFDVDVSGRDFAHGKPDPEMFLTAAAELGVAPVESIVVEDASAGVEAARAGRMPSIGVARHDDAGLLTDAGADVVVEDLDQVDVAALADGRLARVPSAQPGSKR